MTLATRRPAQTLASITRPSIAARNVVAVCRPLLEPFRLTQP
jgi:hypothetical protein